MVYCIQFAAIPREQQEAVLAELKRKYPRITDVKLEMDKSDSLRPAFSFTVIANSVQHKGTVLVLDTNIILNEFVTI